MRYADNTHFVHEMERSMHAANFSLCVHVALRLFSLIGF